MPRLIASTCSELNLCPQFRHAPSLSDLGVYDAVWLQFGHVYLNFILAIMAPPTLRQCGDRTGKYGADLEAFLQTLYCKRYIKSLFRRA
jgi:hypothetical protein